jgi:hypothetical protein
VYVCRGSTDSCSIRRDVSRRSFYIICLCLASYSLMVFEHRRQVHSRVMNVQKKSGDDSWQVSPCPGDLGPAQRHCIGKHHGRAPTRLCRDGVRDHDRRARVSRQLRFLRVGGGLVRQLRPGLPDGRRLGSCGGSSRTSCGTDERTGLCDRDTACRRRDRDSSCTRLRPERGTGDGRVDWGSDVFGCGRGDRRSAPLRPSRVGERSPGR